MKKKLLFVFLMMALVLSSCEPQPTGDFEKDVKTYGELLQKDPEAAEEFVQKAKKMWDAKDFQESTKGSAKNRTK